MKTVKTDQSCVYMDFTASFLLRGACLMCMAVLACDGSISYTLSAALCLREARTKPLGPQGKALRTGEQGGLNRRYKGNGIV